MNQVTRLLSILILTVLVAISVFGQSAGDWRSNATGNWNAAATWQRYNGSAWVTPTTTPTDTSGVITIRTPNVVTISASGLSYDQVTVDVGGQVTVASGITSTLANGTGTDLTVNGTWLNSGGSWTVTGTWAVGSGGIYVHNTTSSAATPLGQATLDSLSTFIYRGSSTLNAAVAVAGRTFGSLTFESSSGSWAPTAFTGSSAIVVKGNLDIGGSGAGTVTISQVAFTGPTTISGNLTTRASSSYTASNGTGSTITIGGNVTNNGTLTLGGTATVTFNGNTTSSGTNLISYGNGFTVNAGKTFANSQNGNIVASGKTATINGTFQINQGSWTGTTGTYSYGASGTLVYNTSTTPYGPVDNTHLYWPSTNGPANVTIQSSGSVNMGVSRTVNGTFTVASTISASAPVQGTAIAYGSSASLIYSSGNNGATSTKRGSEWNGSDPANVLVTNSTTIDYPNGTGQTAARTLSGNLTIDSLSALYMDFGSPGTGVGTLTVNGNVLLKGSLSLGNQPGGDLVVKGNFTRNAGSALTNNGRAISFTGSSAQTIGGTVSSISFDYLTITNSAGVTDTLPSFVNNTLTLSGGTFTTGAKKLTINSGGSIAQSSTGALSSTDTVAFPGTGTVSGTVSFKHVSLNGGVNFGTGSTVTGTLSMNTGSFVNTNPPAYGGSSLLRYNTATTYGRNLEWAANSPVNVQISGNTTLDIGANSGTGTARTATGNLTIDAGSTFSLNTNAMTAAVTINGNITNNGTLTLSASSGGDIKTGGNFAQNGTLNGNGRAVFFTGTGTQTLSATGGAVSIPYLLITNTSNTVQLSGANLTITADAGGNGIQFTNAANTLDLNGQTLTISAGAVSGAGTFKGSSTSNIVLNGTGSFGTLSMTSGSQSLNNFTMNRTSSGAVTLGTPLTVNGTLTLTNGVVSTGANTLTLASAGTLTGGSSTTYINGTFARGVAASGSPTLNFAIGDVSNYTPVSVALNTLSSGGTLTATTTASAHPNIGTAVQINSTKGVNRYWTITNSGAAFTNYAATYNFVSGDLAGSPNTSNFIVGKYNGSSWSYPTVGTKTSTSTQVTGLTSFSDFAIGEQQTFSITATAAANGSISPSGVTTVNYGGSQAYTIASNTGYHIDSVVVDGANQGAVSSYSFSTMTANHTINSYYSINTYTITATAAANGSITPSGVTTVNYGGSQGYSISANTGYHVDSVVVDGANQGAVTSYTFSTVTANHTINAYFSINTFTITATAAANGTISPNGATSVNYGGSQAYTISANTGYHIDSVVVDGANQGAISSYTFSSVTANHTINSYSSINTYTITATAAANGSISPNGAVSVNYGANQAFSISANSGYHIDSVVVDGTNQGVIANYTFTGVTANHSINAYYSVNSYTITATAAANGSISPNGVTNVNHGASQAYTIAANSGYHIDSVVVDGANQGTGGSYTFTNVTTTHSINAYFSINTYTITATAGSNGTISPSGSVSVNHGANQAFSISANSGYHIDSVVVDGANQGVISSYTFTNVTANHAISSYYSINTYTITATAGSNGSISPSGSVSVNHGANQAFSISANSGFHIDSVVVDGANQGVITSYTFTNVTANHTIQSFYSISSYTITATAAANGSISPSGAVSVNSGASQAFTLSANTGYHIDSVVVDGSNQGAVSGYTFSNVTANHSIDAYFSINVYTITATAGANGTLSPSGAVSVNYGNNQAFSISANTGYHIDSVLVDGANQGAISSYTFTSDTASHSISSYYSINTYTITATAGANGSTSPGGAVSVNYGSNQSFTISANSGYHTDSVLVDGSNQGVISSYTFTGVTANHSIDAFFSLNAYTIAASAGANGSISPSGSVGVGGGANQSFTITPNTGYHIDSVVVDGVDQGSVSTYTFTSVAASHTIDAFFGINVYTVTATAEANGSISPNGATSVNYGGTQAYTISANSGYHVDSVLVDGANQGAIASYTFNSVSANHSIHSYYSINQYAITSTASAGGSISPSGSTSVNHGGSQAYTISANTGYHIDSVLVDGATQGAIGSYTFTNVTATHTIAAYFSIDQFTITASAGANGAISPNGGTTVNYGGSQTYTISANTGYHIDSVLVDGANQGAITSFNFSTVTANHSISAYFSIDQFTITASAGANGSISPNGGTTVNYGGSQGYSVTANTGYHIDSVLVDGANQGAIASYTFSTVAANHSIAAYFSIDQFTVTSSAGANGSISPNGGTTVNYGGSQAYAITPNTGYHIDSVLVDGANQGSLASFTFSTVIANHSIAAYFSIDQFTITASAAAHGSISPNGGTTVNYGGSQAYSVTANTGYHIDSVLVDGANQGAVTTYTFSSVTANHSIAAYFSIDQFTITASAGANGTISPNGVTTVNYAGSQAYTITATTGYHIDSVLVDGVSQGAISSYTFSTVTANHSIAAYFSIDQFTITSSAAGNGSISPNGSTTVNYNGSQAYTITANAGYHIDSVLVDGSNQGAIASYTFSTVTANHSIAAYFSIDQFTVTASAGANGTISPNGATTVNYGGSQAYTIAANTGYHVDSVLVDGSNQGAVSSYTFSTVTANHSIGAYFSIDQFTITASAGANGAISPVGATTVNYGGSQAYSISPTTGYHIDSVTVDGANQGAISSHSFSSVTANHTINAYFSINQFTITSSAAANGSISPNGTTTVNYGGSQAYTISPNTGYHIDSVRVDGANQGAIASYTFSTVTANHSIDAFFSIDQFTIAASAGANGTISPNGVTTVNYGGSQAYTVTPATGYHIDSVLVDGASQGALASYTFNTVTANHTIAAYFSIDQFTITSSAAANGSISPNGSTTVNYGGSQAYTVGANTGYHIDSVLVDGASQGAIASYTFSTVTVNHTIAAYFSIDQFTITATAEANGSISPNGATTVNYAASQSYTISANTGFHIDSVLVDGATQGVISSYAFTNVTANHSIHAYFSIDQFTISSSAAANGSISPLGSTVVNYGGSQAYTISANTGYHIDSVLVDGANQGAVASYTFSSVTASHSIAAYFSIDQFTVTATAAANGSISPNGAITVNYGGSQSYTIAANTGYHIDSVTVDGINQGVITSHAFSAVTSNHTINAYFSIDQFTITATPAANGSISPSGAVIVNYGASQAFSVSASTGYHIDSVVVDGVSIGAVVSHTFTNVTTAHTIHAYFSIDQFTITSSAAANGSISPLGSTTVNYGSSQAYTITPATGYHIDSVVADGSNLGAVASHTFSNVTINHSIAAYFSIDQFTITATAGAHGSISPAGTTTINYGGSQAYSITVNTGYHIDSVVVDGVNQGVVTSHTFSSVTANHTITAYFSIDQFVISASAAAHGAISPSGNATVNYGSTHGYTITPATGYHVDSLLVDGVNQGALSAYTFTNVTANHVVNAYFSIDQFTITSSAAAHGSISPLGSTTVNYGGSQAYTITPATGYHIDSVLVDGANLGAPASHTFSSVTVNHSIAAYFSIDQFTITATAAAHGSISPNGATTVNYGGSQAYTVTAATGYHIDSVIVDGVTQGAIAGYTFSTVTASHTIHAYFSIDQFTITSTAAAHGSISPAGSTTVNYGSNQAYTISPATGYHVDSVLVDGANQGALATYTFNSVTAGHTIAAYFNINTYTITVTAGANGSITPGGPVTVTYGANQAFTIAAGTGYHIDSVLVDGISQGAVASYTFTNVTASHTIQSFNSIDQFTITATAGTGGSVTPAGAVIVNYGSNRSFSIAPATGYHLDSVKVDGALVDSTTSFTFFTVTAGHTIATYFTINSFTVTATAGPNGAISPAGPQVVSYGGNVSFNFTADAHYHVDSLFVNGVLQTRAGSYAFTNVTANKSIRVTFAIDSFAITTTTGPNGTSSPAGVAYVPYGGSQTITFLPDAHYSVDAFSVDGIVQPVALSYTFSAISANHTVDVSFRDQTVALTEYRTFTYESMQVKTAAKRTASVGYFEFVITDTTATQVSLMTVNFKVNVDSIVDASGLMVSGSKRRWTLTGDWNTGDSLVIRGWTSKASQQQINQLYYGVAHGRAKFTNIQPTVQRYFTPMPNAATVRDAAFASGVFGTGMVTGIEMPAEKALYGWVKIPKTDLFFKSMIDGGVRHTALRGFNFRAAYNSLSPKRYNDRFFADLAVLKLNVAISSIGMTTPGFGELLYVQNGSAYDRMLISDIVAKADTMLTMNKGYKYAEYVTLDSVMKLINGAFDGPIDTVSSSDSLVLTGVNRLLDVSYLTASGLAPRTLHPVPTPEAVDPVPSTMTLDQNYPNPFNPTTTIRFALPDQMNVTLKVYNMLGQEVATVVDNQLLDAGTNEITLNASDWASGVYFYRIEATGLSVEEVDPESGDVTQVPAYFSTVKKMLLIR